MTNMQSGINKTSVFVVLESGPKGHPFEIKTFSMIFKLPYYITYLYLYCKGKRKLKKYLNH